MKPWEIYTWKFPDAGEHPAVILGTVERVQQKPMINVLLCSSQRANRGPKETEVILDFLAPSAELCRRLYPCRVWLQAAGGERE